MVELVTGALQGPLRYTRGEGQGAPSLKVGTTAVPLEDVLSIRFPEKKVSTGEAVLLLRGGGQLFASLLGGDESELQLRAYAARPPGGESTLRLPLEALRGFGFPRRFKDERVAAGEIESWLAGPRRSRPEEASGGEGAKPPGAAGGEDRLLLTEGAELTGVLRKVDAEAVHFESPTAGEVHLPLAKVRAVALAALGEARAEERPEAGPAAPALTAVVQYQDGSVLLGRLLALGDGPGEPPAPGGPEASAGEPSATLRLQSASLGEVLAPLDRVRILSFRGGRCQYLSDLEPLKVSHREDLFRPWELRRDLAATGDPIRLRGRDYQKGLGMHSHTRVDYALGGRYSRFQAVIGMDDRARPETAEAQRTGGGIAVFRVYLDDRVAFEKELGWSDPPLPLDIPLEGSGVLGLELDYGQGFLVLDRGDWADARILKKG